MKRIKLIGLTCLFFSLLASGQTMQRSNQNVLKNGWKTLNGNSYYITYPGNWDLNTSGLMGSSFFFFSKLTSQQDKFRENVNLIIQDLNGQNISLDKYIEISVGQIKTMITNGRLLESLRLNKNGYEFQKVIYIGDQGVFKLKYEQYCWIKNGKAYILTLTCENKQFENYKVTGEKILNSFKLK